MKINVRSGTHFRDTEDGMVLVATEGAGQPIQFPPIEYIHNDTAITEVELGPIGQLYSYTVVHPGKDKTPYALAMVDFEPGVRAFGRLLLNEKRPSIGSQVRVVPSTLPDGTPDYAFEE